MPIGKNSIKRVANNGYSNVKTAAPDMENSTVIANPAPEVVEKMIPSSKELAPKKKSAAGKSTAKKPAAKKAAPKRTAPKKTETKVETSPEPTPAEPEMRTEYVNLGDPLPDYLL